MSVAQLGDAIDQEPVAGPFERPVRTGKVVLISYAFPPDNTSGAVRVGKFVQHLSQHYGWSLDVITPKRKTMSSQCAANQMSFADSVAICPTRNLEIFDLVARLRRGKKDPAGADSGSSHAAISKTGTSQPAAARRRSIAARISDLLAVPDTRTGWIFWAACGALRSISRSTDRTVLFSSGPPHSAHVAAVIAKKITGRPWVVDLRDPWSSNPYSAVTRGPAERWNRKLERLVLDHADAIICNTTAARQVLCQRLGGLADKRLVTVPNGFDPEDFEYVRPEPCWSEDGRPVLLHAGSIYGERNPFALLTALAVVNAEHPTACPKLVFLGEWDPHVRVEADRMIACLGLTHLITMQNSLPRQAAIAAQAAADGLILLGDLSTTGVQIPGKLFEYLRLQKPILSLFAAGSPIENYLERYAPVHACAAPNDVDGIANALCHLIAARKQRHAPCECIHELSRGYQVELVHNLLVNVLR